MRTRAGKMSTKILVVVCGLIVTAMNAAGQTAKLVVTVTPTASASAAPPSAAGFTVCVGTSADRDLHGSAITPASGIVDAPFQALPAGATVIVTANKTGFTGRAATITLSPGRNNAVTLSPPAGTGGAVCPAVAVAPPAPQPAPAPPAPTNELEPFTLVVFVKRTDGTAIQNAQICVGSRTDVDQYAAVKSGGTYGRATFTLVRASEYTITAAKAGYFGKSSYLTASGTSGSLTSTLNVGTGGVTCPGMAIEYETTTAIPLSFDPVPARLTEEALVIAGTFPFNPSYIKQLDCKQFGTNAVMVGLKGRHGLVVDEVNVLCQHLQSDGKLNSTTLVTERWDNTDAAGTLFNRQCPQGYAVSGATYTISGGDLKSIALQCKPLATTGLTSGSAISLAPAGVPVTATLPSACTSSRPARALKVSDDLFSYPVVGQALGPWVIVTAQLYCEQPVKP